MNRQNKTNQLPQSVAVIGAGKSGMAAARYLVEHGVKVFISDSCSQDRLDFKLAVNELATVPHEAEGHSEKVLEYDTIVISPGVPTDMPIIDQAKSKGIPVWAEIELAWRICRAPVLAVTGATGKSTTVSLMGKIFECAGVTAPVIGNIGLPATNAVPPLGPADFAIIEVSSFQLENIDQFRPRGACVLNILANHLDRYADIDEYFAAKKEIAKNCTHDDFVVLNENDPALKAWGEELSKQTRCLFFSDRDGAGERIWFHENTIHYRLKEAGEGTLDLSRMKLTGAHNKLNACAAAVMAFCAGIGPGAIEEGITGFTGLPHRLEFVAEFKGVKYYNDSKATTAESVQSAVSSFDVPVHLIVGGKDKGCDFDSIKETINNKVKNVLCIGEAAGRIKQAWRKAADIRKCDTLQDAVCVAQRTAREGDVVVLSPGCSSFDMFKNYEHRGNVFKEIVFAIEEKERDA
ncbi:MAG: UDP-N-acetylmuramoyl-L-alanine--D-glutamate ligase [Chitinivibrionales bacterium]|nr:UDP-N-acetylmuramoyl-L-alanine--D-glutamate ligase [Chitinivibrionales bacterium]